MTIEQLRRRDGVNLVQLEADIASVRPGSSLASIALPDYVEHTEGVTRVGALSAEAVIRDYESAAKEIEAGQAAQRPRMKLRAKSRLVHDFRLAAAPAQRCHACSLNRPKILDKCRPPGLAICHTLLCCSKSCAPSRATRLPEAAKQV